MLKIIKNLLLKIVSDIDAGNSNISEEEALDAIKMLQSYTNKDVKMSKYKACEYLNISRATFDNYVREGLLPKGIKEARFKELFWIQKDLDNFIKIRKRNDKKENRSS